MLKKVICVLLLAILLICSGCHGTAGVESVPESTSSVSSEQVSETCSAESVPDSTSSVSSEQASEISSAESVPESASSVSSEQVSEQNIDGEFEFHKSKGGTDNAIYCRHNLTGGQDLVVYQPPKDKFINPMCSYGKWLYFAESNDSNDGTFRICKVDCNGENFSQILDDSFIDEDLSWEGQFVRGLEIYKNFLLIQMEFELYVCNVNTGNVKMIAVDGRQFQITEGKGYFLDGFSLYCYDFYTEETAVITEMDNDPRGDDKENSKNICKSFVVIGDTVYYYQREPDGIYSFRDGLTTLIKSCNADEYSFYTSGGVLYYYEYSDDVPSGKIFRCYDPSNPS